MHEASLMRNLISQIERLAREQGASAVSGIKVCLGALSHFSKAHFLEHFEAASKGTLAEGATVEMTLSTDLRSPTAQDVVLESVDFEVA